MTKLEELTREYIGKKFEEKYPNKEELKEFCVKANDAMQEICERNGWTITSTSGNWHNRIRCRVKDVRGTEILVTLRSLYKLSDKAYEDVSVRCCRTDEYTGGHHVNAHPANLEKSLRLQFAEF